MDNKATTLHVLGMHRSGTSLLAEALCDCGFKIADELIPDQPQINARGFWEDERIVAINNELLDELGSSWFDLRPLPGNWMQKESVRLLLNKATGHLKNQYSNSPLSVAKDPRLCRLLPFWQEAFNLSDIDLIYMIMLRPPAAVARSLLIRNDLPIGYGYLLWERYLKDALAYTEEMNRTVVDYDELLENPGDTLNKAFKELALISVEIGSNIESIADKSLRHHTPHSNPDTADSQIEALDNVYQTLRRGDLTFNGAAVPAIDKSINNTLFELASALIEAYSSQVRVGELHSKAQETVTERDAQLAVANQQRDEAGRELEYAQSVVAERDEQLNELKSLLERIHHSLFGKLALRMIKKDTE